MTAKKPTTRKVSKKKTAKKKVYRVQMTISVPSDLKKQMDSVVEDVNWSASAVEAFKLTLAELGYPPLKTEKEKRERTTRNILAKQRKHKHGISRLDISRSAIKVLAAGMRSVFDINKSGLYAMGVIRTPRGQAAYIVQQEANDIIEEIQFQYHRLVGILKVHVDEQ